MKNHDIVAFYASSEAAERARDELLDAGFDRNDTKVYVSAKGAPGNFWDSIKDAFGALDEEDKELYAEAGRRGASAVAVSLEDDDSPQAHRAIEILNAHTPIDLEQQSAGWRKEGWAGGRATQATGPAAGHEAQRSTAERRPEGREAQRPSAERRPEGREAQRSSAERRSEGREAIPVTQEEVRIGKRRLATGGVRIHSRVTERPVEKNVQLSEEHVHVERHPVDRPVSGREAEDAFRERTIEAIETREEPVVEKHTRVVEEVSIEKDREQRTARVRETERHTDVNVEKVAPGGASDQYETFVDEIVADEGYRGRDWEAMEPDVRRNFEQRYPGNPWDRARENVRRGYERRRGRSGV